MPSRLNVLSRMLKSIYDQFDEIRICLNEFEEVPAFLRVMKKVVPIIPDKDTADNGKFYFTAWTKCDQEDNYYFTLDDDIIYPPDYVEKTVEYIDTYGCIITYHGRNLNGLNRNYYTENTFHHCLWSQEDSFELDVCGTGVTAFRTDYFCPDKIAFSDIQLMSDLVFSLEAAKQKKTIGICPRPESWFKLMHVDNTIFDQFQNRPTTEQNKLANEIFKHRHPTLI